MCVGLQLVGLYSKLGRLIVTSICLSCNGTPDGAMPTPCTIVGSPLVIVTWAV